MPKFFVKNDQISGDEVTIIGQDVNHIINVLRLKNGDRVNICDINSKNNYVAEITNSEIMKSEILNAPKLRCKIIEKIKSKSESNININLFQGLPKGDKMELIIEKNIEIGVNEITPVEMRRCVVKLDDKNKTKKIERWQKIAETAAKQCGRDILPKINGVVNIKNICNLIVNYDIVLIAYEEEQQNLLKNELKDLKIESTRKLNIGIIIGPEGGMEQKEVELLKNSGAKVISLGKRILRTETARISNVNNYYV